MPNKPLLRFIVIGSIVLVLALLFWYTRKATWTKMIQKKWGSTNPDATSDEVLARVPLIALMGMYYNGQEDWQPHA